MGTKSLRDSPYGVGEIRDVFALRKYCSRSRFDNAMRWCLQKFANGVAHGEWWTEADQPAFYSLSPKYDPKQGHRWPLPQPLVRPKPKRVSGALPPLNGSTPSNDPDKRERRPCFSPY